MRWLDSFLSNCPSPLCCPAFLSMLDDKRGVGKGFIWRMVLFYCHAGNRG